MTRGVLPDIYVQVLIIDTVRYFIPTLICSFDFVVEVLGLNLRVCSL